MFVVLAIILIGYNAHQMTVIAEIQQHSEVVTTK